MLYAVDLAGAASGCLFIAALQWLDGVAVVLLCAALAVLAAVDAAFRTRAHDRSDPAYRAPNDVPSRWLQIDAHAGTQRIRFDE